MLFKAVLAMTMHLQCTHKLKKDDSIYKKMQNDNMAATMLNALCCFFIFLLRFLIIAAFERWEDHLRIVGTICCSIHEEFTTFSLDSLVHLLLQLAWSYSRELFNPTDFASLSTNGLSTAKHA